MALKSFPPLSDYKKLSEPFESGPDLAQDQGFFKKQLYIVAKCEQDNCFKCEQDQHNRAQYAPKKKKKKKLKKLKLISSDEKCSKLNIQNLSNQRLSKNTKTSEFQLY